MNIIGECIIYLWFNDNIVDIAESSMQSKEAWKQKVQHQTSTSHSFE